MTLSREAEMPAPPSRRTVLMVTGAATATALLILFAAVLPAEYHRDPTGLGALTGVDRLWSPAERVVTASRPQVVARSFVAPFRSDVIEIPLRSGDDGNGGEDVEYKVGMNRGAAFIYSWDVPGIVDPEEFYSEFHGHSLAQGSQAMVVTNYRKATGKADNGVLTAPFDGVHGWYFQNQSAKPVTVRLRLSGFYTLIPDGQPGNEKGLHARPVAF